MSKNNTRWLIRWTNLISDKREDDEEENNSKRNNCSKVMSDLIVRREKGMFDQWEDVHTDTNVEISDDPWKFLLFLITKQSNQRTIKGVMFSIYFADDWKDYLTLWLLGRTLLAVLSMVREVERVEQWVEMAFSSLQPLELVFAVVRQWILFHFLLMR